MTDATSTDPFPVFAAWLSQVLSDSAGLLSYPADVLLGLEAEFRVVSARRITSGEIELITEQVREGPCPARGVLSSAVKDRPVVRIKDLPASGQTAEAVVA